MLFLEMKAAETQHHSLNNTVSASLYQVITSLKNNNKTPRNIPRIDKPIKDETFYGKNNLDIYFFKKKEKKKKRKFKKIKFLYKPVFQE